MTGPVVLAVDGNSLVHRSFHAQARTGQPSWAVRGLLTQLVAAVDRIRPALVVVGFDDPDRSLRRTRFPEYKANRAEKLDTLIAQLAEAIEALQALGIPVVVPAELEADDVVASVAAQAPGHGATTVVVTSDRDSFALIDERTSVLRIINGGVEASPLMTPDRLRLLLGVSPDQYRDYAALRGDPSDNLPGVRGVGPRTAARLLAEFGCARAAFDDLAAVAARVGAGVAARLADSAARPAWERNCAVMAQHCELPVPLDCAGAGALPLVASTVAGVFRAHGLVWSVPNAVRVLADTELPAGSHPAAPEPAGWGAGGARRLPRLAPRRRAETQLTLF